MVLYHCCNSLALAQAVERTGFEPADLIPVTNVLPETPGRALSACRAIVFVGVRFGFKLDDYPQAGHELGSRARLVSGLVLNQFPRAIWPE